MKIPIHKIENYSSNRWLTVFGVPTIKRCNYFVDDSVTINGDAPKKFIGVYSYPLPEHKRKRHKSNWVRYIAKTGQKWYPVESITELLLNNLGTIFGLSMAESKIAMIGGQLRFLSRYFLNSRKEELVHGADIIAGYLNESPDYVEKVDEQKLTRELFTLQFIEEAITNMFVYQKDDILHDLVRLIIFDAVVGNNDRHFFNWGVVKSIDSSFQPHLSPVYDTARGLFWNDSEEKLKTIIEINKNPEQYIRKYCKFSRPKIGWDGDKNINHFKLFGHIFKNRFYVTTEEVKKMIDVKVQEQMHVCINKNFDKLMTSNRRFIICECLKYRFNELRKFL